MPKFTNKQNTVTVELPSYEGSKVTLKSSLSVGNIKTIYKEKDEFEQSICLLLAYIKDWNFVDEDDNPVEVTRENIEELPLEDFQFLSEKIQGLSNKKKGKTK